MASKPGLEKVSCLNSLSLHFLIYKMEITIIKLDNMVKEARQEPATV